MVQSIEILDSCCNSATVEYGPAEFDGRRKKPLESAMPVWWNRQTRRTQNPVGATQWEFDSPHRHQCKICGGSRVALEKKKGKD
jgi:hypothetical protein